MSSSFMPGNLSTRSLWLRLDRKTEMVSSSTVKGRPNSLRTQGHSNSAKSCVHRL